VQEDLGPGAAVGGGVDAGQVRLDPLAEHGRGELQPALHAEVVPEAHDLQVGAHGLQVGLQVRDRRIGELLQQPVGEGRIAGQAHQELLPAAQELGLLEDRAIEPAEQGLVRALVQAAGGAGQELQLLGADARRLPGFQPLQAGSGQREAGRHEGAAPRGKQAGHLPVLRLQQLPGPVSAQARGEALREQGRCAVGQRVLAPPPRQGHPGGGEVAGHGQHVQAPAPDQLLLHLGQQQDHAVHPHRPWQAQVLLQARVAHGVDARHQRAAQVHGRPVRLAVLQGGAHPLAAVHPSPFSVQ